MNELIGKAVVRTTYLKNPEVPPSISRVYTVGAAKAEASRLQNLYDHWYHGTHRMEVVPLRIEMLEPLK